MKASFGSGLMELVKSPSNAAAAVVLIAAYVFSSFAWAIPTATTQAGASCYNGAKEAGLGPGPVGFTAECDYAVTLRNGSVTQMSATARTGLGPGVPLVGNVDATASVSLSQPDPNHPGTGYDFGYASAGGDVTFYFESERFTPGQFNPATLPIYFGAHGDTSTTNPVVLNAASAQLQMTGSYGSAGAFWEAYANTNLYPSSFDEGRVFWFAPGELVTVELDAACLVKIEGSCSAFIDPVIRFDQAAFDAKYGANSFNLTDYYRLHFSDNIVPVPAAVWLFGSGLLGLIAVARRK